MEALRIVYVLALVAVVAVVPLALLRKWMGERAGHASNAFAGVAAPASRHLKAEVLPVTWVSYEVKGTHTATRVSIQHSARLPYVVQFDGGKASCYETKGYREWTGHGGDPRCVPLPAQEIRDPGLLFRLQSVEGLSKVTGIVAVGPEEVVAFEERDRIAPEYARSLTRVLLALADEAEAEKPLPRRRPKPALS